MFIGHYAPAFLAAAVAPRRAQNRVGLGSMFIAAQLIDIVFFTLFLAGVEHMGMRPGATVMNAMDLYDMPWDHSLTGAACWAAGFALVLRLAGRGWGAALLGAAVVLSHWLLDLIVHRPDLTLAGGPPRLGLGLWNYPMIEIPLELALAYGALGLYAARTRPSGAASRWLLLGLAVVMALLQAINWLTPPPPAPVYPVPSAAGITALGAYAIMAALAFGVAATRVPLSRH